MSSRFLVVFAVMNASQILLHSFQSFYIDYENRSLRQAIHASKVGHYRGQWSFSIVYAAEVYSWQVIASLECWVTCTLPRNWCSPLLAHLSSVCAVPCKLQDLVGPDSSIYIPSNHHHRKMPQDTPESEQLFNLVDKVQL